MRQLYAYVANELTHDTYISLYMKTLLKRIYIYIYIYIISLPLFEWRNTVTPLESFSTARL